MARTSRLCYPLPAHVTYLIYQSFIHLKEILSQGKSAWAAVFPRFFVCSTPIESKPYLDATMYAGN